MPYSQIIHPRADAACGKVFYEERRAADEFRIVLDFWNRAMGHVRKDYQLGVYRCKRCGGFHIAQKRNKRRSTQVDPRGPHHNENSDGR